MPSECREPHPRVCCDGGTYPSVACFGAMVCDMLRVVSSTRQCLYNVRQFLDAKAACVAGTLLRSSPTLERPGLYFAAQNERGKGQRDHSITHECMDRFRSVVRDMDELLEGDGRHQSKSRELVRARGAPAW